MLVQRPRKFKSQLLEGRETRESRLIAARPCTAALRCLRPLLGLSGYPSPPSMEYRPPTILHQPALAPIFDMQSPEICGVGGS